MNGEYLGVEELPKIAIVCNQGWEIAHNKINLQCTFRYSQDIKFDNY